MPEISQPSAGPTPAEFVLGDSSLTRAQPGVGLCLSGGGYRAITPTRLAKLEATHQKRLINWGYAVCDAAMRKYVEPGTATPNDFPYPSEGVG